MRIRSKFNESIYVGNSNKGLTLGIEFGVITDDKFSF